MAYLNSSRIQSFFLETKPKDHEILKTPLSIFDKIDRQMCNKPKKHVVLHSVESIT
jgi:hypothetical protein